MGGILNFEYLLFTIKCVGVGVNNVRVVFFFPVGVNLNEQRRFVGAVVTTIVPRKPQLYRRSCALSDELDFHLSPVQSHETAFEPESPSFSYTITLVSRTPDSLFRELEPTRASVGSC
jgi:hypothetical protein